jgi:lipoprotein-releasing system permease protein
MDLSIMGDGVQWLILGLGVLAALAVTTVIAVRDMAGIVARRFLSHIKLTVVSVIMICAVVGTTLAVAALTVVMGISTGFQAEFQRRVLGVNAHVVVLKYGFSEYRRVMDMIARMPGVEGVDPFVLNEMMLVADTRIAGVLLKGVDPYLMPDVLDLPQYLVEGSLAGLRLPGALPPSRRASPGPSSSDDDELDMAGIRPPRQGSGAEADVLDDAVAEALGVDDAPPPAPEASTTAPDLPGIVLGRTLARELDLDVGETVRVMTPLSGAALSLWAPEAGTIRSREYRVVGVFYSGFDEYDRRLVFVDLFEAQAFSELGDAATGIELRLADPSAAPAVAERLRRELGRDVYQIIDWQDLNRNLFTALFIQKVALTLVVSALVLVSGLLIISTLVMLIFEKKRAIAILKAIGATDLAVMRVFVFVGMVIGSLGTFLGISLGYGICKYLIAYAWTLDPEVYLIDRLPVAIVPLDYLIIACVSLGISALSTLVPSWLTAARMKPVDGLRYE